MNQLIDEFNRPQSLNLRPQYLSDIREHAKKEWSPYELNGGNVVACVQGDIAVIAGDTRLTRGFSILKRDITKIHKLTKDTYILSSGMYADILNLWKLLDEKIKLYELNHQSQPGSKAIASMISNTLYQKRFFPFYSFNIVVGFEDENASIWSYDAIGSYDKSNYSAQGNAKEFIIPLLDNQFEAYNSIKKPQTKHADEMVEIVVDAFQSTAERDITCGDGVEVIVLKKGEVLMKKIFPLRKD